MSAGTFKVKFLPHEREIVVQNGQNLIHAAMNAGVHINASCGGEGVCGKCRVLIEEGDVEKGISEKLSREDSFSLPLIAGFQIVSRSVLPGKKEWT